MEDTGSHRAVPPRDGLFSRFALGGRTAVVTGGNTGLGEGFARALAEAGAAVAIAARDQERSQRVADEIGAAGGRAIAVPLDVRELESIRSMLEVVSAELGGVNVLVNNSGVCFHRPAMDVPEEEWSEVFDVNLHGLWHCSREAARSMMDSGGGSIVNIGSISAQIVNRPQWQPAYNASKAAVHQLTKSLAAEWAPHRVRVNALAPGYVKTAMSPVDDPRYRSRWIDDAPMQRYATPEEIAPAVVFLASEASSFMTGSVVVIDGGYTLF